MCKFYLHNQVVAGEIFANFSKDIISPCSSYPHIFVNNTNINTSYDTRDTYARLNFFIKNL